MTIRPEARRGEGRGLFVVLDGVDGCGKSTQATELARALAAEGREVAHLREPGSTDLGEGLRELLLEPGAELSPAVETLLFTAARRQMLEERVAPVLARGGSIVCERFHASTFAYQAVAAGLDEDALLELLHSWAGAPEPDLTVVLEIDVDMACARRGAPRDRIEARGSAFQERVAAGFRRFAERIERVVLVDGRGSVDEVAERVRSEVDRVLG